MMILLPYGHSGAPAANGHPCSVNGESALYRLISPAVMARVGAHLPAGQLKNTFE